MFLEFTRKCLRSFPLISAEALSSFTRRKKCSLFSRYVYKNKNYFSTNLLMYVWSTCFEVSCYYILYFCYTCLQTPTSILPILIRRIQALSLLWCSIFKFLCSSLKKHTIFFQIMARKAFMFASCIYRLHLRRDRFSTYLLVLIFELYL